MELIELVANNQYMFTSDRNMKRGVMEVDIMDAILTQNKAMAQQLTTLNKKLEKLEVSAMAALEKLTLTTAGFVQSTNNFIEEARANFGNQKSSIGNLETQLGQIAKQLSTTLPNSFPSNTEDSPKGECKAITLRSGKALEDVSKKVNVQPTMPKGKEDATRETKMQQQQQAQAQVKKENNIPFPQQLRKEVKDKQFFNFLEGFRCRSTFLLLKHWSKCHFMPSL
ncbi:hypothetical protein PIB30_064513 [Stylosanthes scabra]|uniref:Uncharacterized protein n=1 Tax=Stylosanthes scabra TaxID=79078 RepID=A0ABU6YNL2_9FABA|nr:hypothetical protein [Stylosanthes scabra]